MRGRLVIRGDVERLRSSMSFSVSGCAHAFAIGWLAFSSSVPALQRSEAAKSAYDLEIRPYEKHLVWYNLKEKLPDIGASKVVKTKQPLRAKLKFQQNVVAGNRDLPAPPQLIRMAAPQITLPKELALPNMLATAPPKPLKPFQPPPPIPRAAAPQPVLPDAPRLATDHPDVAAPFDAATPRPQPRAFSAPPPVQRAAVEEPVDPAAPEVRIQAPDLVAPKITHGFSAPARKNPMAGKKVEIEEPPPQLEARAPVQSTLAVVGLNPVKAPDAPLPAGSHEAAFSAGPVPHPTGSAEAPSEKAAVNVAGVVARGGKENPGGLLSVLAPLSQQRMAAAERAGIPHLPSTAPGPRAARVASSPDPRLRGRYIYTVAIQMPNVTSYSGSWIVWFADRDPVTGAVPAAIRPPLAIHKVDPKYIQTAVEERVQGVVRLAAVIRLDGHVEEVELLQHLDERLDRSAKEALLKWVFEPAQRNGVPVEVDAVFEIPFRLAPKNSR